MNPTGIISAENLSPVSFVAGSEAVAAATAIIAAVGLRHMRLTPLAARIAAERGLDISTIQGRGYAGKIFADDLTNASLMSVFVPAAEAVMDETNDTNKSENTAREAMVAAAISVDDDVVGILRMNDARRAAASATVNSALQTAAVTQHMETDITSLIDMWEDMNTGSEKPEHIPLAAFYLKAMAFCLREQDRFRLRLAESGDAFLMIEGAPVCLQLYVGDSTTTFVLRDVDLKSPVEIAEEISLLTEKAKRGGLTENDISGGAITLIEKSGTEVRAFTPIINLPEAAVLGIGAPYRRLVMTDKTIENRKFVMQSLTFDHRIINGAEADEFQKRIKDMLENPQVLAE